MSNLEKVKFELDENYLKPVFKSLSCSTNNQFKCMLDSGAGIPVWSANEDSLTHTFPTAVCRDSYKNLLGGFGAVFQAVKVYYIPKVEFSNGENSIIFEDFYLPVSIKRSFGVDLILPTSMIKESKIILSQIDVRHQGKTLELQCSTRYFKAHYTLKHLFASDVNYYKTLFERQKIELQKQKELNLSIHDVLIGAEGEYDRILTQEELNVSIDSLIQEDFSVNLSNTRSEKSSTTMKTMDAFNKI